jgi:hypothetical protein
MPHYTGTFCTYDLDLTGGTNEITFSGSTAAAPGTAYAFTVASGASPGYEPAGPGDTSPISHRLLRSKTGVDIVLPPNPLPENKPKGQSATLSFGHGAGMKLPIRLQVGSQDPDNQHSGSGMIHLMFSHARTDLTGVIQLLNTVLLPSNIGAIYKTKTELYGHHRFFWLSRNKFPIELVTEVHDTYHRVITAYKSTQDITKYNKFKTKTTEYTCLYRWHKDQY